MSARRPQRSKRERATAALTRVNPHLRGREVERYVRYVARPEVSE
jgi:hypothetical protein